MFIVGTALFAASKTADAINTRQLLDRGGWPRNGRKSAARSRILKKKAREGIMAGIMAGIVMMFLGIVVLGAVEIIVQLRRARPEQEGVLMIRKLARQAVIFALLGQLLATAWFFVTGDRGNRALARGIAARAVHGELYHDPDHPLVGSDVFLSDGTRLVVRFCASNKDQDCREDLDHVERDYWAAYKADRDRRGGVLVPLVIGLKGFPWGLGAWGFYRLILFAVKGRGLLCADRHSS